jgi:hypothetical protein
MELPNTPWFIISGWYFDGYGTTIETYSANTTGGRGAWFAQSFRFGLLASVQEQLENGNVEVILYMFESILDWWEDYFIQQLELNLLQGLDHE